MPPDDRDVLIPHAARPDSNGLGSDGPPTVPVWLGARVSTGARTVPLTGCDGAVVARVVQANRLVQHEMLDLARRSAPVLGGIDDETWFGYFSRAAAILEAWLAEGRLAGIAELLSRSSGLPVRRVERGIAAVVGHLGRMETIMAEQSPDGTVAAYRTGRCGARWSWLPAGRTCMVRVPANFPTIMIEWLQVLAARRSTLVNTSERDPFTAGAVVAALYRAGLPDGAVSVCHGEAATWVRLADQVVWPGEDVPPQLEPARLKMYHFGRSKTVLLDSVVEPEVWTRLARLAFHGSGRLCTNMSALAVTGSAERAAQAALRLAEAFAAYPVLPLSDPAARVPAFPDRGLLDGLARMIEREVAGGAVDMSARVTGAPLRAEIDGVAYLRPAVLLASADSPLFQMELPFPFTTVAHVPSERLPRACAPSLIVSVVGEDRHVVDRLAAEPTITKVFSGDLFDRGYDPVDPQEGYLADFLFQKKSLLPLGAHDREGASRATAAPLTSHHRR